MKKLLESVAILEYSAKELVDLAKSDTPKRYQRRQSLGQPRVVSAHVNYKNGSAVIVLNTHDHEQVVILEDFVQLVADEVLDHLNKRTLRKDIAKLVKLAIRIVISSGDVLVDCDCDDYKYRFNWIAKQYGYAASDRVQGHNYAPKITNPKLKGAMCKHLIRVLARATYWNDTAGRYLINDLLTNKEFVSKINDSMLDKKEYSEDKDYDINQPQDAHPNDREDSNNVETTDFPDDIDNLQDDEDNEDTNDVIDNEDDDEEEEEVK